MNDQPLTKAEETVARILASGDWEAGVRNCDIGSREDVAQYARDIVAALFPKVPCPTCSGPTRETTHMICLECGTDYTAAPPQKITNNALAVLRASLAEVKRLRAETTDQAAKIAAVRAIRPARGGHPDDPEWLRVFHDGRKSALRDVARALGLNPLALDLERPDQ